MPTIIDSLVVELGLDTSKFEKGQQDAIDSLRNLEERAGKHAKGTKSEIEKLTQSFSLLQNRLLAIGGLIATGLGFNRLTQEVTKLNTELGFMSDTLGVSVKELSAFQNAARSVGASPSELAATIANIQKSRAEFQLSGSSPLVAFSQATKFNGQGPAIELYNKDGSWKSPEEVMIQLSRWYQAQPNKAVATQALTSRAGVSQGAMNLLSLGPEELQKRLDFAKRFAPTNEEVEKFKNLTKAFGDLLTVTERLGTIIVEKFAPALTEVLKTITDWLAKIIAPTAGNAEENAANAIVPDASGSATSGFFEKSKLGRWWSRNIYKPYLQKHLEGDSGAPATFNERFTGQPAAGAAGSVGSGTAGGSEFLRQQRQSFANELQDPTLRRQVAGMAMLEGVRDPVPVVEALANRYGYVNEERARRGLPPVSVRDMLTNGFYGPINRGQLPGAMNQLSGNPGLSSRMNSAIDTVLGGSNVIRGFTDQGLPSDPNGWRMPQVQRGGNVFPDWAGGPGGPQAAAAYRERLQAGVAAESANKKAAITVHPVLPSSDSPSIAADTPAGRSFNNWRNLNVGSRGALLRDSSSTTNNNTSSSSTNIGNMNVTVPPGADPTAYASGIRQELERFDNVQQSNTGLQ